MGRPESIYEKLTQEIKAGRDCALITILKTTGSVPRAAGAEMLVMADHHIRGTIGGGSVEHTSCVRARELLENGESVLTDYNLGPDADKNDVVDLGMVCGGNAQIFTHILRADDAGIKKFVRALENNRGKASWVVTDLTVPEKPSISLMLPNVNENVFYPSQGSLITYQERTYFTQPINMQSTVYVFGAGHVSEHTIPLLSQLGFSCIVYDDKLEFATPARFPDADEMIIAPFDDAVNHVHLEPNDYIIVMTRGHVHDYEILSQFLGSKVAYIGSIGSRKKIAVVNEKLRRDGYTQAQIDFICAPIGLDIGAQTPTEIAVSIAAQLIQRRAERASMPER